MSGVRTQPGPSTATTSIAGRGSPGEARRGVSRRSVIEEAKVRVETVALAELLCGPGSGRLRRVGDRWTARCPLPDHEDRTPSFTVYTETNSWYCFGACQRGGDVVDLAAAAWGYGPGEMAMAAADLLREFGHPIPERPRSWYARQERQKPVRDGIEAAKVYAARRRLYRQFFEPLVLATEDEEDRQHDAELFWEVTAPLAEHLIGAMMARQQR
jgi:DNA primase